MRCDAMLAGTLGIPSPDDYFLSVLPFNYTWKSCTSVPLSHVLPSFPKEADDERSLTASASTRPVR